MQPQSPDHLAIIALGGNLGNSRRFFQESLNLLADTFTETERSSLYLTAPYGDLDQQDFTNAVVAGRTTSTPLSLIKQLQLVEKALGKRPTRPNGPRCIDLDLLFWDDLILNTPTLTLPHPRAHLRDFVLLPLVEILPDFVHPVLNQSVQDLLQSIPENERYFTGTRKGW